MAEASDFEAFNANLKKKPQLIVFDLDYTFWPFWVDTHVRPPFGREGDGRVYDGRNNEVTYYSNVPEMLEMLHKCGYKIGIASRTGATQDAETLLKLFDWNKYITYKEIYRGDKTKHFAKFKEYTGLPYNSMLFFDDEIRNIYDTKRVGVHAVLADDGMSWKVLREGLSSFADQ